MGRNLFRGETEKVSIELRKIYQKRIDSLNDSGILPEILWLPNASILDALQLFLEVGSDSDRQKDH